MENEKIHTQGIKPQGNFQRKLENYWYHYKWQTIAVLFFVIVFTICTLQMCSKDTEDATVLYAGPVQMSTSEIESFKNIIAQIMPEDFDGNGKKTVGVVDYQVYSEAQIKEIEEQTDEYGVTGSVNRNYNSTNYENYSNYILTGETTVCFLDPFLYEKLKSADRLAKISDTIGYTPSSSSDGYGVALKDTGMYRKYSVLSVLPENTVICILRSNFVGKNSKEEAYARDVKLFASIIEFESAEAEN